MSRDMANLQELYAGRALEPLSPHEGEALDALEREFGALDDGSFELIAGAVALAGVTEYYEPLPDSLRRSLVKSAPVAPPESRQTRPATAPAPRRARPVTPVWWRRASTGWMAAAVCLVLAVFGWSRTVPLSGVESPRTSRESLLRSAPDVLQIAWTATEDPLNAGASGDVVWSNQSQEGYMTFRDLPVNDPTQNQYQLWIFDGTRNQDHPIDGGVFDVTGSGEAVIPIQAKLGVREPALFAVTLEPPGGVVVSSREHLLLVAAVSP